jgi:hypothetical protein
MGFMGACPIAGVVWQHVHYIVGLQRLGHEVYYIEDSARIPYNPETGDLNNDFVHAANVLGRLAIQYGFEGRWAFRARYLPDHSTAGLDGAKINQLYSEADAILNVCGAQELNEELLVSNRLLYIESDPGVEQVKVDKGAIGTINYLARHKALFTFGENVGTEHFPVPVHGHNWLHTRQPVVTDLWKSDGPPPSGAVFTTVANWSTSGRKDIEWKNETYLWSKSIEFLKFVEAPRRSRETFEIATEIKDLATAQLFDQNGWRRILPNQLSVNFADYRQYFRNSKGEFTVAKDQYVRLNTGWFSDRTACYLAAGRPAITQETGFTRFYGSEGGLFSFRTMDDIIAAVEAINADYKSHCKAAYAIACEVFEAEKILADLLSRAGV